jgi:hypothetical protein
MTGATWAAAGQAANSNKLEIQRIAAMILDRSGLQSAEWRSTVAGMDRPIEVDLPHKLGREEARRRIAGNVHKLSDHIPGGAADVKSNWVGDQLNLDITAMGQTVAAQIDVQETKVRCRVMLPGLLALFAAPIEAALNRKGSDLLLEDRSKKR